MLIETGTRRSGATSTARPVFKPILEDFQPFITFKGRPCPKRFFLSEPQKKYALSRHMHKSWFFSISSIRDTVSSGLKEGGRRVEKFSMGKKLPPCYHLATSTPLGVSCSDARAFRGYRRLSLQMPDRRLRRLETSM